MATGVAHDFNNILQVVRAAASMGVESSTGRPELIVLFQSRAETIRIVEFFAPSWKVAVLTGMDANKNVARIVSPFESLQLVPPRSTSGICRTVEWRRTAFPTGQQLHPASCSSRLSPTRRGT